ncbi:pyridoxamine 5'-phosphate oxidase family protein [Euzebya tangerina]|uniref:pyridoxamine 5'-phosphate oxidase family protein n=1 Tax=Euzebya tangerina TaxID=591198 RepID=UPI000E323CB3|nr:pyridoxamine 5'-phosphate oxidase family protein [Euzebya tangerina]
MSWQDLDHDACVRFLSETSLGRLAFTDAESRLTVLPVNYHWDGEGVLIRTGAGSKLASAARRQSVAFEIDSGDTGPQDHSWSVLLRGTADVMPDASGASTLETVNVSGWIGRDRPVFIRIDPTEMTGRELLPA